MEDSYQTISQRGEVQLQLLQALMELVIEHGGLFLLVSLTLQTEGCCVSLELLGFLHP